MGVTTERGSETYERYARPHQAILHGELQPNKRLIEMELARRYTRQHVRPRACGPNTREQCHDR
jgi:DNA-binding GntR family transcriptional regulator